MNILLINLDYELAQENGSFTTGAYQRHIEYVKLLSHYFIISRTTRSSKFKIRNPIENLRIFPSLSLNKISFIYDAFRIGSQICKGNKIDIICCQDPFSTALAGYLLKRRFGIPLNIHILADIIDNPYFLSECRLNYLLNKWVSWIIKKADAIRISTSKEKEKLAKLGIEDKKIWCIPFFINFDFFSKNDGGKIRRLYLNERFDRLVLSVGRITKQKDLGTLIQAIPYVIKEYPKVLFLIIGQGPEERRIKNFVLNLAVKDNVCFLGNITYDKIPDFFSACDLFVTTSLYEGTNMTLLEAQASGKPVVSTSHAGAYGAIEDGKTGFILNFKDAKNIAQKIIYLLKNPKTAKEMGEEGRTFVLEHFDKDRILEDYLNMFKETINSSKNENKKYFI